MFTSFIWAMENLKRRRMKASILMEALVAMAVFAAIASLLLGQISQSRQEQTRLLQEEEVLRVARMAMQTGQERHYSPPDQDRPAINRLSPRGEGAQC